MAFLAACNSDIDTVETRDEQGKVKEVYTRSKKDFLKDGLYKRFFPNGTLHEEVRYVRDKMDGERKFYFENGVLESSESYRDGVIDGVYKKFYPNGVLQQQMQYVNGAIQGQSLSYYPNGVLKEKVMIRDNDENGPFVEYYENGNIKAEGTYANGPLEEGALKEYDENGVLVRTAECAQGRCTTVWKKE